jgi:rare lipoprotein A
MRGPTALLLCLLLADCREKPRAVGPTGNVTNVDLHEGLASYYAQRFDGMMTASGVRFNNAAMVAAHPTLPFGSVVRVTNLTNGRSVHVRIIDRGPSRRGRTNGVVIDVSRAAAQRLGFVQSGRAKVRLEVLRNADFENHSPIP